MVAHTCNPSTQEASLSQKTKTNKQDTLNRWDLILWAYPRRLPFGFLKFNCSTYLFWDAHIFFKPKNQRLFRTKGEKVWGLKVTVTTTLRAQAKKFQREVLACVLCFLISVLWQRWPHCSCRHSPFIVQLKQSFILQQNKHHKLEGGAFCW
jgi:hypothetical protein